MDGRWRNGYTYSFESNVELDYGWYPSASVHGLELYELHNGSGTYARYLSPSPQNPTWQCSYCKGLNFTDTLECVGCGSRRTI